MSRINLYSIGKAKLQIGSSKIMLDTDCPSVSAGGTCLVYHAYELIKNSMGNEISKKIILKEFYPELPAEYNKLICRKSDGRLVFPENIKTSGEFMLKLERFKTSYDMFIYFHNNSLTNNYTVEASSLSEAYGTWYMIMNYNQAESLTEYIESRPSLNDFLKCLQKSAEAVSYFHALGYLHLDLTPSNILFFSDGYIKIMDTDSFILKSKFALRYGVSFLPFSDGFTAPEIVNYDSQSERLRIMMSKMGETSDIFSIGAIFYRFLFKENVYHYDRYCSLCSADSRLTFSKDYQKLLLDNKSLISGMSLGIIKSFSSFLSKTLSPDVNSRYKSMTEVSEALNRLINATMPNKMYIRENYHVNNCVVYGREKKLEEIENAFKRQINSGSNRIVFIHGIGGIGKSTLAREYASIHRKDYDLIIEISVHDAKDAIRNIDIVNFNYLNDDYGFCGRKMDAIKELLAESKALLIVHNYDILNDEHFNTWYEIPCDIIITSRYVWNSCDIPSVSLNSWDLTDNDSFSIFAQSYKRNAIGNPTWEKRLDRILSEGSDDVMDIIHKYDSHPFFIKLIATQMSFIKGYELTPKKMLKELDEHGINKSSMIKFHNSKDGLFNEYGNAYHHLAVLFKSSAISGHLNKRELEILRKMTLVSSKYGICAERLNSWYDGSEEEFNNACSILSTLCEKGWLEYYPQETDLLYPDVLTASGVYKMPLAEAEILTDEESLLPTFENSFPFLEKCSKLGRVLDYGKSPAILEQLETVIRNIPETIHGLYADILYNYCVYLQLFADSSTKLKKELLCDNRLIKIRESLSGLFSEKTGDCYALAGTSYIDNSLCTESIYYRIIALLIRLKILGLLNAKTATSYDDLGISYEETGDRVHGLQYQEMALIIRIALLGDESPDTAKSYDHVGISYEENSDESYGFDFLLSNGEDYLTQYQPFSLNVNKPELSPEAADLYNMAADESNGILGFKDLETLLKKYIINHGKKSRDGDSYIFLPEKSNVKKALKILSRILSSDKGINTKSTGLRYQEKALELRKKLLGEMNSFTAISYNNIGYTYVESDNMQVRNLGIEYLKTSLKIFTACLGSRNPDIALSYSNLGLAYLKDKNQKIRELGVWYLEKALDLRKSVLSETHIDTSKTYYDLAKYYVKKKSTIDKAIEYLNKSKNIRTGLFGRYHRSCAECSYMLAHAYALKGEYSKALTEYNNAIDIMQKIFGSANSLTRRTKRLYNYYKKKQKEANVRQLTRHNTNQTI